jgi:hypothetical protein
MTKRANAFLTNPSSNVHELIEELGLKRHNSPTNLNNMFIHNLNGSALWSH